MSKTTVPKAVVVAVALALLSSPVSIAAKDKTESHVTVAFGAGLNTAQPGNTPNHHVLPQEITVKITKAKKLDGTVVFVPATVNFVVSGYHFIWVYNPGVTVKTIQDHLADTVGLFIDYNVNVFAKGVFPGTPPAFIDAGTNPSGVMNRTDSFGFSTPGRYLVICNVRPHFMDGMYAWINVVDDDDED